MAYPWKEYEIERLLKLRDLGWTEQKIAEKLTHLFMRKFTRESVNSKIKRLKASEYLEHNRHVGHYLSINGDYRKGKKETKKYETKKQRELLRKSMRRYTRSRDSTSD